MLIACKSNQKSKRALSIPKKYAYKWTIETKLIAVMKKKHKQVKVISVRTEDRTIFSSTDMCLPYIFLKDALIKTETDSFSIGSINPEEIVDPEHPP